MERKVTATASLLVKHRGGKKGDIKPLVETSLGKTRQGQQSGARGERSLTQHPGGLKSLFLKGLISLGNPPGNLVPFQSTGTKRNKLSRPNQPLLIKRNKTVVAKGCRLERDGSKIFLVLGGKPREDD